MPIIAKSYQILLDMKEIKLLKSDTFICQIGDSIKFIVTITEDGKPKDLTGVSMDFITAIGESIIEHKFGDKIKIIDAEKGIVEINPKVSFNDSVCTSMNQLVIYDEDESVFTQQFLFNVKKNLVGNIINESKDDIATLNKLHSVLVQYQTELTGMEDRLSVFNERLLDIEKSVRE